MSFRFKTLMKWITGHISVRLAVVFIAFFIVVLVIGNLMLSWLFTGSINRLENLSVTDRLLMVRRSYEKKIDYLGTLTVDWGVWDDSYEYVQNGNREYIQSNLPDSEFGNLDVNLIMITDNSGKVIFGEKMGQDGIKSPPDEIISEDLKQLGAFSDSGKDNIVSGVITLPGGAMMISAHPIVKTDGTGPPRGSIIFGRYFDDSIADDMTSYLGFKVSYGIVEHDASSQGQGGGAKPEKIVPESDELIKGYEYIPDLLGNSDLVLTAEIQRDVYDISRQTASYIMLFLALWAFIALAFILFHFNRLVVRKITRLQREVSSIAKEKDMSKRVSASGACDEIYSLSADINGMIGVKEELYKSLRKSNDDLELSVGELTVVNKELSDEKEKIKHLAYHDSLTGLPNGVYFSDLLSRAIVSSYRLEKKLAVLFIDLDGFKIINDSMGHAAGDKLLVSVTKRISKALRKSDFMARIGGDEFIILIDSDKDINNLERAASRLLDNFENPYIINGQECFISASIGIAVFPDDGNTAEELMKNADLAMYNAKDLGKSRFSFCDNEMKRQIIENMVLSNQLWRATERGEFELYYQPQVSCLTNEITGMEALIRWNHPERGLVMPGKFIPFAEQTGAVIPMGEWALKEACARCREWQKSYFPELMVSVNVSIKQLQNDGIIRQVEKALSETGLKPSKLEIEVTESIFMKDADLVIKMLDTLKGMGVMIAIDDFGTEYSSMNYLKRMAADRIKIAMQFVQGIETNEKDQAITNALIILAKNMGMSVIAEGVETKEQLDFLVRHSCDEIQGFYMYRPMPAGEMEKVLSEKILLVK